jgi:ubiquinone/menaquinone biosynthesis C-methylase UbiE
MAETGAPEVYSEGEVASLELVWGDGYLSPGGPGAVARILEGVEIKAKSILDLGCGIGGPAIDLVRKFGAQNVVGIDVVERNIEKAQELARRVALNTQVDFRTMGEGRLPFADQSFDIVFSKDALIEAKDKALLLAEAFRILKRGCWFVGSDWLRKDGPIADVLQHWIDFSSSQESPHSFALASLGDTVRALEAQGFAQVAVQSENAWYRLEARRELALKTGPHWQAFVALRGEKDARQSVEWHQAMIAALDSGDFCPSVFRARKPE